MELIINARKENNFLKRVEIEGLVNFNGSTPQNQEIIQQLAKKYNTDPAMIVLKHIYTSFGHKRAIIQALIYADATARRNAERVSKSKKKEVKKETKEGGK